MIYYFAIIFYLHGKPYTIETFEMARTEQEARIFAEEYINILGCDSSYDLFYQTGVGSYGRL